MIDIGSTEEFLAEALPAELDDATLADIAATAEERTFPTGETILAEGGAPSTYLYVIRSGSVEIRAQGRLLDVPGEKEVFGELSLLAGTSPTATVRAAEPVTCLLIDREHAERVLGTRLGVAFVQASLQRSLSRALDTDGRSLLDTIRDAEDRSAAIDATRRIPAAVCELVDGGADAVKVGRVVGSAIDALTSRLLAFAEQELGAPPAPWAWLALGSEARLEQALHTDQDHALVLDPADGDADRIDPYFARFAEQVTAGLEAAGIPRCHGDAMATHPGLRRSLASWRSAITGWMADPGVDGSILSSIVFDFRRVAGPLDAEPPLHEVIAAAPARYPQFIRHLTRRALDRKPPTGFRHNVVVESKGEHAGHLDIKHGGVTIVSNLGRAYTIAGAGAQKSTLDRLAAAAERGQLDDERREALEEAFRLLWQVRLEHQVAQVRAGRDPDDYVDPATLGPITRLGLKEAFKIIGQEQQMLAADLGVDL